MMKDAKVERKSLKLDPHLKERLSDMILLIIPIFILSSISMMSKNNEAPPQPVQCEAPLESEK